jgi:hypothetical protein
MNDRNRALVFCGFVAICLVYSAWMTGGTFAFSESDIFPNYNMLAKAFANGQLFIDEAPPEDDSPFEGKRYLYFGPAPALMRLPVELLFACGIPSGLMIALFCAGSAALFIMTISELTIIGSASDTLLKIVFALLFLFNGYSLLMTELPTIHHEAIAAAMFFLMASIYLLAKSRKRTEVPSLATAMLMGLCLACSLASRGTYFFSCGVIAAAFIARIWSCGENNRSRFAPTIALAIILAVAGGLLLTYNYARFNDPLEFGMKYQMSAYRDYLIAGNFARYEHIPYNVWSLFFRLPLLMSNVPFLVMPRYVLETRSVEFMPYFLVYANELSVSVFILMPVLVVGFVPLVFRKDAGPETDFYTYLVLFALVITQVFPIVISMSTVARYYYDFVPVMILMAYMGGLLLKKKGEWYLLLVLLAAAISIIISFALPMNAASFYLGK